MEGLDLNNIWGGEEIDNLFPDNPEEENETTGGEPTENGGADNPDEDEKNKTTEVVDPEDLFEEEEEKQPESVGSGEKGKGKEDSPTDNSGGASPTKDFYSSIANAMLEDGIFPNLDEETINKVVDAETLSEAIEAEINARFDETQQRISKALKNGVEPSDIRKYENTLSYLSSLKDSDVAAETPEGEKLRYSLITQDLMNKGMSPEKADKIANRSIDAGTDVEDAKEALQGNKDHFQEAYNKLLKDAEKQAEEDKAERKKQAEKLKKTILEDKQLLGGWDLSNDVRKKAFENISKPVYKDPETGEYMTALQKYEMENRQEFLMYAGLFMALTNGFKDFESFTKGKVKKEVKKGLRDLEQVLNNTRRNADGSLKYVTSVKDDPESFIGQGFKLDI